MRLIRPTAYYQLLLCAVAFVAGVPSLEAAPGKAETLIWNDASNEMQLAPGTAILPDPDGRFIFDDVRGAAFTPHGENPAFGFLDYPLWVRVRIQHDLPAAQNLVLEIADPFLREIDLYLESPDGSVRHIRTGAAVPSGEDPSRFIWPAVPVELKGTGVTTLYLRVVSDTSYRVLLRLYQPIDFERRLNGVYIRTALNYGISIYILASSFFIWYRLRERSFALYIVFLLLYIVLQLGMDGFIPKVDGPFAPDALRRFCVSFYPLVAAVFCEFFLEFAGSGDRMSAIKRGLRLIQGGMLLMLPVFFIDMRLASILAYSSLPLVTLYIAGAGAFLWIGGYRHIRYLFFASLPLLSAVTYFAVGSLGWINHDMLFEEIKYFNILAGIILAISLADRFSLLQQTHRENLREAVEERTSELLQEKLRTEAAIRQKEQAMRIVSHDLRSPLSAMKASLPFLSKEPPVSPEDRRALLKEIEGTVDNLLSMSGHLLETEPAREGRPFIEPEWCSARSLAATALRELAAPLRDKGASPANRIPMDLELLADRRLMTRVLVNLIGNAIKFSRAEDSIEITAGRREETIRLSVRDTGVGVQPELLPDLLNPTVTTTAEGTASEKGLGLGLIFCREIATLHGGALTIESGPGKGTAVHVDLPLLRCRDEGLAASSLSSKVVLIVDDYEPFREQVRILLGQFGIATVEAGDGKQALRLIEKLRPDLVLTDLVMPEVSGDRFLKSLGRFEMSVPVWVISGRVEDEARVKAQGAQDFFKKPLDIVRFRAAIKNQFSV